MITTKLYLDCRGIGAECDAPLKFIINYRSKTAFLPLGISLSPKFWNKKRCTMVNHPLALAYNSIIQRKKMNTELALQEMIIEDETLLMHDATYIKNALADRIDPERVRLRSLFIPQLEAYIDRCEKPRTKDIYERTLSRLYDFDNKIEDRLLTDIDYKYLTRFDEFLKKKAPSANARAIHFRNIRAVFNHAITEEITTFYPFRKFKIKTERTRKRALPMDVLCKILHHDAEDYRQRELLDMFSLSFYLIGINVADMYELRCVEDGRIEYDRAKTKRHYSIKVEPEAMEIIKRYKGKGGKLLHFANRYGSAHSAGLKINEAVKAYTKRKDVSMYWARHSWATIAARLDIPKETIAAALGHGQRTVTDIYIDFDLKKVDEANRRVIDYVKRGSFS